VAHAVGGEYRDSLANIVTGYPRLFSPLLCPIPAELVGFVDGAALITAALLMDVSGDGR
jgi:hypothetical protein